MRKENYYRYYCFHDSSRRTFRSRGMLAIRNLIFLSVGFVSLFFFLFHFEFTRSLLGPIAGIISPVGEVEGEHQREVFGFAPYWKINDLENVDFSVLTTFAYFGVEVRADGSLDRGSQGYRVFQSDTATRLFDRAHQHNTKVVLTLTQMDADSILAFLDDPDAQDRLIEETAEVVRNRGIDGINIDFEYFGESRSEYRTKFSSFVAKMNGRLDEQNPDSHVTVSLYASAVKSPRIYDVASIAAASDGIFMMAYDFATASSEKVMPTAPLYGYSEGKYWYDISTAVDDFLTQMPAEKLILGLPWYGYNYPVSDPTENSRHPGYYSYYWRWGYQYSYYVYPDAKAQTYGDAMSKAVAVEQGWDEDGKVGWIAYQDTNGVWRKVYQEDSRSLSIKYDFAIEKNLGGVGMWALGFDNGRDELWTLLNEKFGTTLADARDISL